MVMMLRLQRERMDGALIPSMREYYHRFGLDAEKLAAAKPDAIVMHPGPMNRGVEIDGTLADDINVSVIQEQVEMGVAVRMAAMDLLARNLRARNEPAGGAGMLTLDQRPPGRPGGRPRLIDGGAASSRRPDRARFRGPAARATVDCGGACLAPGHHRHRRQGRRAGRAPQGELPHRRRRRRRRRRHHHRDPPRHRPAIDSPETLEFLQRRAVGGEPGPRPADGGADQGPRRPRDDRDRLPDGRRRRRLHRRPAPWRDARVFQRCLTYAAGLGALVVGHPQEPRLSAGACMTAGQFASQLGLPGGLADRRAHRARARPRARRGDRRALPRRPDLDRAEPARARAAPRTAGLRSPPAPRSTT